MMSRSRSRSYDRRRRSRSRSHDRRRRRSRSRSRSRSYERRRRGRSRSNEHRDRSRERMSFAYFETRRIQRRRLEMNQCVNIWSTSPEIDPTFEKHELVHQFYEEICEKNDVRQRIEEEEDDELELEPLPLTIRQLSERDYGDKLLPGEGTAMASFVQSGVRIPRRGEIGFDGEQIQKFEDLGFVMSGSRNRRMNAIRIRKENQVIAAEKEKQAKLNRLEDRLVKEQQYIADLKKMIATKKKEEQ